MTKIDGVIITPLKKIVDERGMIMHMLKRTDPNFTEFGEIYFSCGYPGVVKAWHIHKEMTLNDCCVVGMVKLVIFDCREHSATKGNIIELFIGEDNYCVVQIPPGVANGYKAFGDKMAIVANCASMPHDKSELIYIDPFKNKIPYDWNLKHG
ncbi:dTDP-4-dehydrorhamnose 3,5-epimerase family protein [Candidatus Methylopumilus planktonicus]|uniref:dTDP-4-dehydrorhamnose 3,5-epimerase family protein n=1 Tax=Candidatus Methylopumilus planktonicus TaxID=1581557 RepID=UPI003BEF0BB5